MSTVQPKSRAVDEDDDLDDLDDVIDQFSQPALPQPQPASASASTPAQPAEDAHDALADDLAAELAKEMESLFNGLGNEPGTGSDSADGAGEREQLAAAWEAMLVESMNAMSGPSMSQARGPADAASPKPTGADFQSSIRSTLNRLRESESGLHPSDSSAGENGDTLQSLLSQLGEVSGEGEEQIQGVLEAMMGQLMGKDVLYEPLKELHDKFPGYLADHASTITPGDKTRYEAQISCIKRLIDAFEAKTYRDDDDKARDRIVELMNELQSHGSPPAEIMGPLPPGFTMGADGLPEMPDGCNLN